MKAIIVDDEPKSSETLKTLLHDFCKNVEVVAACQTIAEAAAAIAKHTPDVVFLDINLRGENGFDLLNKISSIDFEIVFATAYSEYAIKAFKFSAIDYLLKPIDIEELRNTIAKIERKQLRHQTEKYKQLLENLKPTNEKNYKLALPSVKGLTFVKTDEIVYCEADSNYTTFYLSNGEKIIVSQTLKEYDEMLTPHRFFRIHHSYLVNMNAITHYLKGDGGQVVMSNGTTLDVAKRRKEEFLKQFSV